MIKAFIFDVDGTLIDTRQLHIDAWKRAFKEHDFDIPDEAIQAQLGRRSVDIADALVPEERAGERMRVVETKWRAFRDLYPHIEVFPRVRELFSLLNEKGLAIGIATSAVRQDAEHYIKVLSVGGYVGALVTGEDIERSKPDPEIFLKAASQLGVEPHEVAAVGDSPHDIEAASRAGMAAIGVLTGGYLEQQLRDAGAFTVYRDIEELYEHLADILYCPAIITHNIPLKKYLEPLDHRSIIM